MHHPYKGHHAERRLVLGQPHHGNPRTNMPFSVIFKPGGKMVSLAGDLR